MVWRIGWSRLALPWIAPLVRTFDFTEAWQKGGWLIGAACNVSDGDRDVSHNEWLLADRERARRRLRWAEFFEDVDVLLCPITSTPAFPHQQEGIVGHA